MTDILLSDVPYVKETAKLLESVKKDLSTLDKSIAEVLNLEEDEDGDRTRGTTEDDTGVSETPST